MMKSWSNIVQILSVCAVVMPTPVPQFDPFGLANFLNPNRAVSPFQNSFTNPTSIPSTLLVPSQPIYPASSGLPGASNRLGAGVRDTGVALVGFLGKAVEAVTETFGILLSGLLGTGQINDAKYVTFKKSR